MGSSSQSGDAEVGEGGFGSVAGVSIGSPSQSGNAEVEAREVVAVVGALIGAVIMTLDDEIALLDDEVSTGAARAELEEMVLGGVAGGLVDPSGALPAFVHAPAEHFWYKVIAFPPPQLERGSPAHFMLQFPRIPGLGTARGLRVFPQ
jgi:hypothetical protein